MTILSEIEKIAKNRESRAAVGAVDSGAAIFYDYQKLLSDSLAAASLLQESCREPSVSLSGLGSYLTAVFILACSRLGYSAAFGGGAAGILIKGSGFIHRDELYASLSGRIASVLPIDLPPRRGESYFSFPDGTVYSESAAILSAVAFAEKCAVSPSDRLLFISPEESPEGLFCGILAPLLRGASCLRCSDPRELLKNMKSASPTKLFCPTSLASALVLKLSRIKSFSPPGVQKRMSQPSLCAVRRMLHPRVTYELGGRLKTLITLGELSETRSRALISLGIFPISVRSERGLCPALFHYGGDDPRVWQIPEGSLADLCHAGRGGVGRIIIFSPAIREGEDLDATYVPLEKHFDGEKTALVTTLSGYILKDGSVFKVD